MKRGSICLILCLVLVTIGCQQGGVDGPSSDSTSVSRNPGEFVWKQQGSRVAFPPVVSGDSLLWSAMDGSLNFLDINTGEPKGREVVAGGIAANPQLRGSVLYFVTRTGDVVAYDAATKSELWRNQLSVKSSGEPAIADGLLIVPLLPSGVCAISTKNGEIVWQVETDGLMAPPTVDGDSFYFGTNSGILFSFNIKTGAEQWRYNQGEPVVKRVAVGGGNIVIVTGKSVAAFSKDSGLNVWNFVLPKKGSTPPVVSGDLCLVATSASQVFALSTSTGKMEWGVRGDGSIIDVIYPVGTGDVVVGSRGRTLAYLNAKSGKVDWSYTGEGWFSTSPLVSRDKVFVADNKGVLHSIAY